MLFLIKTALRYSLKRRSNTFAFFVAMISTFGIAIGVMALIVVSSVMQGLELQLKNNVLGSTAHLVIKADEAAAEKIFAQNEEILGYAPFFEGRALVQSNFGIGIVTLQGQGEIVKKRADFDYYFDDYINPILKEKSYRLEVNALFLDDFNLTPDGKVRLISTLNASYGPLGLTPRQRNFTIADYNYDRALKGQYVLKSNLADVRSLFRIPGNEHYYRMFLKDPFTIQSVIENIDSSLIYSDWRDTQGEFFKAVGMERISMSLMLCLIIVVAAFNILSALTMMVSSRKGDIAILKTMGLGSFKIILIFIFMGLTYGVLGVSLGIAAGVPLAYNASFITSVLGINALSHAATLPVFISAAHIAFIALSTLLLCALCSLYPAYKAGKADAITNLAHS
ncbi:Lipoprotein-releasing system transmembrane protein lolC [Anaerobiospirillum thomasii]|uniref:FtsX-like permease family protein n=1 Tax=Anaerobiospirillum thomasii TaxID=179995 RepID=UPI000D9C64BD|nr:FtsX-like permease family protein [Anaerobiospirillum thomasii]SPT71823.1 Lipoprotein-releasing system transmembrane protein lolC [Anaerobiospirillum thomasii]